MPVAAVEPIFESRQLYQSLSKLEQEFLNLNLCIYIWWLHVSSLYNMTQHVKLVAYSVLMLARARKMRGESISAPSLESSSSKIESSQKPADDAASTTESDGPKEVAVKLTAGRGTLKRKRQLQALINQHEQKKLNEDEMDLFSSTPFRVVKPLKVSVNYLCIKQLNIF